MVAVLGWADYVVCGLMLAISTGIGVYYRFSGDKQRTNKVRKWGRWRKSW